MGLQRVGHLGTLKSLHQHHDLKAPISLCIHLLKALPTVVNRLPWWLSSKESTCQCRRHGFDPWVRKIPWRRKWQPTLVFLPGKSHGQKETGGLQSMGWKRVKTRLIDSTTATVHLLVYCFHRHHLNNCLWWELSKNLTISKFFQFKDSKCDHWWVASWKQLRPISLFITEP